MATGGHRRSHSQLSLPHPTSWVPRPHPEEKEMANLSEIKLFFEHTEITYVKVNTFKIFELDSS